MLHLQSPVMVRDSIDDAYCTVAETDNLSIPVRFNFTSTQFCFALILLRLDSTSTRFCFDWILDKSRCGRTDYDDSASNGDLILLRFDSASTQFYFESILLRFDSAST